MPPADDELLRRIAESDVEAFESLYRRYARTVYGLALRRLLDAEAAGDATQRAFAAVWRSAATELPLRGDGARWLFMVVDSAIAAPAAEDGWPAFRLHAAVAELPEEERVPLELAYWEGRSESEIAAHLGLPLDTVKARTCSALRHLAAGLDGAGP